MTIWYQGEARSLAPGPPEAMHAVRAILAAMLVLSQSVTAVTAKPERSARDKVPSFDVVPHCRSVAELSKPIEYFDICLRKEWTARDQLVKHWTGFHPADRSYCTNLTTMGSEPIYTALISCLELARDARNLQEKERSTSGQR